MSPLHVRFVKKSSSSDRAMFTTSVPPPQQTAPPHEAQTFPPRQTSRTRSSRSTSCTVHSAQRRTVWSSGYSIPAQRGLRPSQSWRNTCEHHIKTDEFLLKGHNIWQCTDGYPVSESKLGATQRTPDFTTAQASDARARVNHSARGNLEHFHC